MRLYCLRFSVTPVSQVLPHLYWFQDWAHAYITVWHRRSFMAWDLSQAPSSVIFGGVRAFSACPHAVNYSFPGRRLVPCGTAHHQPWLAAAESVFNFTTSRMKEEITEFNAGREHCRANGQGQELLTFPLPSKICPPVSIRPAKLSYRWRKAATDMPFQKGPGETTVSTSFEEKAVAVGSSQPEAVSWRSFWE